MSNKNHVSKGIHFVILQINKRLSIKQVFCFTKLSKIGKALHRRSFKNPERLLKAHYRQTLINTFLFPLSLAGVNIIGHNDFLICHFRKI
jgi:hypothetical protein